jgi:DNA-binding LacI/PurR family transcriptional regulator
MAKQSDGDALPLPAGQRRKYASSTDVARLAGVSQAAVSRSFTEGASVSAETRRKVVAAAEHLGYWPSTIPRIMLTHRSSLIAVVSGGLHHPFYASIVERFSREIQKTGSTVLLFSVNHGEYMDEIIPKIMGYRVDGIISALSIVSAEAAESCAKMNVPVVLFNSKQRNEWVASICSDNVGGGREVASLFLKRGARRFGYLAGKKGNMANEDRLAGYFGRLIEEGSPDLSIAYGNFSYEDGYKAACELIGSANRPDAIFCANDLMAIAAREASIFAFGLRVPEDIMIAGFDDIPSAAWPSIDLTTIRQDGPRMVTEALATLDAMICGRHESGGLLRIIPAPLIERGSTRRET